MKAIHTVIAFLSFYLLSCSPKKDNLNCNSTDIEFVDSCLLGVTIKEAIQKLGIDTSQFVPILLFAREVDGIYVRANGANITLIVKEHYIMSNEELAEIETPNHSLKDNWRKIYRYIMDREIQGICWRKNNVGKTKKLGNMTYHQCFDY